MLLPTYRLVALPAAMVVSLAEIVQVQQDWRSSRTRQPRPHRRGWAPGPVPLGVGGALYNQGREADAWQAFLSDGILEPQRPMEAALWANA